MYPESIHFFLMISFVALTSLPRNQIYHVCTVVDKIIGFALTCSLFMIF